MPITLDAHPRRLNSDSWLQAGNPGQEEANMNGLFRRHYDFHAPLDAMWDTAVGEGRTFELTPAGARLANSTGAKAEVYLRPCSIYGDVIELAFAEGAPRRGLFEFCFSAGMEYLTTELDFATGALRVITQEHHKAQPRFTGQAPANFSTMMIVRRRDALPCLPYEGSSVEVLLDGRTAFRIGAVDFLPECMLMFGLIGQGELTLRSVTLSGPPRPRPEYLHVGTWQQSIRPATPANVDALIEGVAQAAAAGVQLLVTPETSLTGLRPAHADLADKAAIRSELKRFQDAVASFAGAPYTLIGYPEWIPGSEVDGATLDEVRVNCHRFVRPDGTLGPMMAKVHSCEAGLWHGRHYNLQRVCGAEAAVGVCHDGMYHDVWATGVMGGARLCLHPMSCGGPAGAIDEIVRGYGDRGGEFSAFWVTVNSSGGGGIFAGNPRRDTPKNQLALPADLTEASPTYPQYTFGDNLLTHATIRLWDATGSFPLRTLRSGRAGYENWSRLVPQIRNV